MKVDTGEKKADTGEMQPQGRGTKDALQSQKLEEAKKDSLLELEHGLINTLISDLRGSMALSTP